MIDLKKHCEEMGFKVHENNNGFAIEDRCKHTFLTEEGTEFDNTVAHVFKAPLSINTCFRAFDTMNRQRQIDLFKLLTLYATQMDEEDKHRDYWHTLKVYGVDE